jgi:hypothetical protein
MTARFDPKDLKIESLFDVKGWVAVGVHNVPPCHRPWLTLSNFTVTGGGTGVGLVSTYTLVENGARVCEPLRIPCFTVNSSLEF